MNPALRTVALTLLALAAFAANSIFARVALRDGTMDPLAFTALRIASGALVLALLLRWRGRALAGDWPSAAALVVYAAGFSVAYVSIPAGIGALMLFGAVQITMIAVGLANGERPHRHEWIGEAISVAGLVGLLLPGASRPPLSGSVLMIAAGIAWAIYSLRGRRNRDPLAATAGNFVRGLPLALLPWLALHDSRWTPVGIACAMASGALASGLGYAVWYTVLPGLTALRASIVQIAVPLVVAVIGIAFLGEPMSWRLGTCAILILGGLALAMLYQPVRRDAGR